MAELQDIDWSLLFVDDHPIYCDGLKRALAIALPGLSIHAADGMDTALRILENVALPDLVISDQRLLDGDGVSLIRAVRQRYPAIAVGLLCAEIGPGLVSQAKAVGAVACLSKDRNAESLADALRTLFAGGSVFDNAIHEDVLSLRRRRILALASEGLLDKQIGEQLGISESTVRNHWQNLFLKLGAANRTEAVTRALRQGLI